MTFLTPWIVVAVLSVALCATILLNTVIHETGHALGMLALTQGKVRMYLGSYGADEKSWHLNIGRLEIRMLKNIMRWRGGLCKPTILPSLRKRMLYIIAGPMASLLFAVGAFAMLIRMEFEGAASLFFYLGCVYMLISFFANLIPRSKAIHLADGQLTYNDGQQLVNLWRLRRMPPEYFQASEEYLAEKFEAAADRLQKLIANGIKNPNAYRLALGALVQLKRYDDAYDLNEQFAAKGWRSNATDRATTAMLLINTDRYEEAIRYLKQLLVKDGLEKMNLNSIGYALTIVGRYEEAITYLDDAINRDASFSYPYGNRAFALMQLGKLDEGRADNERACSLDPNHATHGYAFRNEGVYFLHTGNYERALQEFKKAEAVDSEMPGLQSFITEAKASLQNGTYAVC